MITFIFGADIAMFISSNTLQVQFGPYNYLSCLLIIVIDDLIYNPMPIPALSLIPQPIPDMPPAASELLAFSVVIDSIICN